MDLDDGVAGEVIFGSKVDSGDEYSVHSEPASFIRLVTPLPHLILFWDGDQIADLDMETGGVVFGLKGVTDDEHDDHAVLVSLSAMQLVSSHISLGRQSARGSWQ